MKPLLRLSALLSVTVTLPAGVARVAAGQAAPSAWRQYATPEEAGWSSEALAEARRHAERIGSAAVMVVYKGHVLAAWGDVERRFEAHSVRKTLLNALYGIHVAEETIDIQRTLAELGIRENVPLSENEQSARVVDLLHSMSGVFLPAAYTPPEQDEYRPERDRVPPGRAFFYNNWDFNTLGTILMDATGVDLFVDFERRVAKPLGMEDFRASDGTYVMEPSRSMHPAYTFRISTRDLARFGLLYAQRGLWGSQRIISSRWISDSWTSGFDLQSGRGYGYLWHIGAAGKPEGLPFERLKQFDRFLGLGTGGQMLLVIPDLDFVFVHRGDTDNDRRTINRSRTRTVRDVDILRVVELILAAQTGEAARAPHLVGLTSHPLPNARPAPPGRIPTSIPTNEIDDYVGTYRYGDGVDVTVYLYAGDRLFMRGAGFGEVELFRQEPGLFFLKVAPLLTLRFLRDDAGTVQRILATEGEDRLEAIRLR